VRRVNAGMAFLLSIGSYQLPVPVTSVVMLPPILTQASVPAS
jgi:hypothetical protein